MCIRDSSPPERPTGAENRGKNKTPKKDRTHWLYIAVIIAVVAGIVFGIIAPDQAKSMKVVGTMFVSLVKMIIAPVIFCTIVLGIGSVRAAASVGKAGGIALAYFVTVAPEGVITKLGGEQRRLSFAFPDGRYVWALLGRLKDPVDDHRVRIGVPISCLLYTSPSPRDATLSRMPSSA